MNEKINEESKSEPLPIPIVNVIEDSIASRTKEITKRPKRERSPTVQIAPPAPKIKKNKEVAPKLPDKTKWTMEEQKQFFSALRIYGKNFEALGHFFNTRRRLVNPEAQKRTFGQIRCFYYRSFRTVSKLCTFTEEEKSNVDSLELRSVLAYLCLKPKVKCFDKKPTISVLHQLIRNGSAFLRVKGQREHVSIIGKALKPPKAPNTLGSTKHNDRTLSKHVKIFLSPASTTAYMRVALSCRYPHVEILLSRSTTIHELIDKLTQYWQLNNYAQTLVKDDCSMEQVILYPHGSYLLSADSPVVTNEANSIFDLLSTKQIMRSRSDSEHSTEQLADSSSNTISNKPNLARTAILSAAKRAASNNNHINNIDGAEDEPDSSSSLFKQRFDTIDLTDEFGSEDEIEPDQNLTTAIPILVPTNTQNNPSITLPDLSQGITKTNSIFLTLTIGELQKLLQRPKEVRLIYDFNNLSRTNTNESSPSITFLHYVIQMANQCLTSIAERQTQTETKTIKKTNTKKQQILRSKCYCTCCPHHHSCSTKDQRRASIKHNHSPNADICALLQMPQTIPTQDFSNEDILTVQTSTIHNAISDADIQHKSSPQIDEQNDLFDRYSWTNDNVKMTLEQSQTSSSITPSISTSNELPSAFKMLLPMMNGMETTTTTTTSVPLPQKPSAIIFSSNNGVIDDPLIQSLAAEQAASAHNYDRLSYRHKRVRRPLRYGDQSTRPSNIQLLLDANINAQQAAAANQRLLLNSNATPQPDLSALTNNPFSNHCENSNDPLNDNTNMSTFSLSTTIINAALQSNTSRLRLDWPDNLSDLSFGSFPELLESEQSTTNEQNKCASENSISDALFTINNTTNLLLQN